MKFKLPKIDVKSKLGRWGSKIPEKHLRVGEGFLYQPSIRRIKKKRRGRKK